MNIVIPLAGRVRMCIRSSFVVAQRTDAIHFDLTGDSFNLMQVTSDQVFVLPDEIEISEGQEMTDDLITHSLPLEQFVRVSAEEAVPAALGLLLRLAVADGRLTDAELLSIQPALEGRLWQPALRSRSAMCTPSAHSCGDACRIIPRREHGRPISCPPSGVR